MFRRVSLCERMCEGCVYTRECRLQCWTRDGVSCRRWQRVQARRIEKTRSARLQARQTCVLCGVLVC
jgi:hypothetical protein